MKCIPSQTHQMLGMSVKFVISTEAGLKMLNLLHFPNDCLRLLVSAQVRQLGNARSKKSSSFDSFHTSGRPHITFRRLKLMSVPLIGISNLFTVI